MTDIIYTHRTRDGNKARIIGEIKDDVYPIVGAILLDNETKEYVEHFTKELKCIAGDDSEYDLFEYSPWNDVKLDTPILVSNSPHAWVKRHFAKNQDGHIYVWEDGRTSWTTPHMVAYKYAKLPRE